MTCHSASGPRIVGGALLAALLVGSVVTFTGQPHWLIAGIAQLGGYAPDEVRLRVDTPATADPARIHTAIDARLHGAGFQSRWRGDELDVLGASEADLPAVLSAARRSRRFELVWTIDDDPVMAGLVAAVDEFAGGGVAADHDSWRAEGAESVEHVSRYVRADRRERLEAFLAWARTAHPELELAPGRSIAIEQVRSPGERITRAWVIAGPPVIDNGDIASVEVTFDPMTNKPVVLVTLSADAASRFGDATASHLGRKLAIVVDGEVKSAPIVEGAIRGGQVVITVGAGDPRAMKDEADGLAAAISAGPLLPDSVHAQVLAVRSARRGWLLSGAAVILALLSALLALAVAIPLGRLAPFEASFPTARVATRPWPPAGDLAVRIAITLGLVGVVFYAQSAILPWINELELASVIVRSGRSSGASLANASIVALGITPIISAAVLVELVSLMTRRGRRRRLGGPAARAGMTRAVMILALVLALVQGYFVARYLESLSLRGAEIVQEPGWATRFLIALTLAGGVAAMATVAALIGRHGVGNGYAVLLVAGLALDLRDRVALRPDLGAVPLATAVIAVVAIASLTLWSVRTTFAGRHRLPLGGVVPLQIASSAAGLLAILLMLFGVPVVGALAYLPPQLGLVPWLAVVVIAATISAWIAVAIERRRLGAVEPVHRGELAIAIAVSVGYLVIIVLLDQLARAVLGLDALVLAVAAAIALDLISEVSLRAREGRLVAVASLQAVIDADRACAALATSGIPVACQGLAFRALTRVLGPFVPIDVLVPAELADRARELVDAVAVDAVAATGRSPSQPD